MSSRGKKKTRNAVSEQPVEIAAKKEHSRKLKITALALIGVFGTLLLLAVADVVIAWSTVYRWTHPEKQGWTESPMDVRLASDTFELETPNGTVYGWVIPAQEPFSDEDEIWEDPEGFSDKTVVFAPNYDSNRELTDLGGVQYFVDYCQAGYNVVTFDWTGSGYSDGDFNAFTLDKIEELKAVISYAKETTGASFLALQGIGFSSYSAAVVTAESDAVDALILDSCYDTLDGVLFDNFGNWSYFDLAPVRGTVRWLFPLLSGVDSGSEPLRSVVGRIQGKHIFFIQGEQDELFGSSHLAATVSAAKATGKNQVESWTVASAGHLRARSFDTEIYFSKISEFLENAANPTSETA